MPISTVSAKGQITLPVRFRERLKIKANDRVSIEFQNEAIVIKRAADFFELKGFLGRALPEAFEKQEKNKAVSRHMKGWHS
jgi:AbrB family looped-hinge helix DNA binding protein